MKQIEKIKELEAIQFELEEIKNELNETNAPSLLEKVASLLASADEKGNVFLTTNTSSDKDLCDYYETLYTSSSLAMIQQKIERWVSKLESMQSDTSNKLAQELRYEIPSSKINMIARVDGLSKYQIANYWNSCLSDDFKDGKYRATFISENDLGEITVITGNLVKKGYKSFEDYKQFRFVIPQKANVADGQVDNGGDIIFKEKIKFLTNDFIITVSNGEGDILFEKHCSVDHLNDKNIFDVNFTGSAPPYTVEILSNNQVVAKEAALNEVFSITIDTYQFDEHRSYYEDYEEFAYINNIEFPVKTATLFHKETAKQIHRQDDCAMELKGNFYQLVVQHSSDSEEPHGEYYWVVEGYNGEVATSSSAMIAGKNYYPSLLVKSVNIKEIPIPPITIDFKPEKMTMESSGEPYFDMTLGKKITLAKWNHEWSSANKESYNSYCIPREKDFLIIKGVKNLTRDGDDAIEIVEFPPRNNYFEYYSIVIRSSDGNFHTGSQLNYNRIFDEVGNMIDDWADKNAIIGISFGIENVNNKIKQHNELVEWRATLAKDLVSTLADVVDVATQGSGIAPIIGSTIVTLINMNKDSFKVPDVDKNELTDIGIDLINKVVEDLRKDLLDESSKLHFQIKEEIKTFAADQQEENYIISLIRQKIKDKFPARSVFEEAIERIYENSKK